MANFFDKIGAALESPKGKAIMDKITTWLLIALFCSPFAILIYILLWFVLR